MRSPFLPFALLLLACEPAPSLGTACERASDCSAPYVCRLDRCRAECQEQRDCPIGALCLIGNDGLGSCALNDDPDCTTRGCAGGLACVSGECVNLCETIAECPGGSECAPTGDGRARCVRADALDGSVDASTIPDTGHVDQDVGVDARGPRCVPGLCDAISEIVSGDEFSCVRTISSTLWCWGAPDSVARGPAPVGCSSAACPPAIAQIEDEDGVHDADAVGLVSAREYGGCFTSNRVVSCWGAGPSSFPLGNDGDGRYARPVLLAEGGEISDAHLPLVLAGSVLATRVGDGWLGWGDDDAGQFGGRTSTGAHTRAIAIDEPAALATDATYVIAVGDRHGCAIVGGDVWCWGANDLGQVGIADPIGPGAVVYEPRQVAGISGATELALGPAHTCALVDGNAICWGDRRILGTALEPVGCIELGSATACPGARVPVDARVELEHLATQGRAELTCAIALEQLLCWGADWSGTYPTPTIFDLPALIDAASVSWSHICVATSDDRAYCRGQNMHGELARDTGGAADTNFGRVVW